MQFLTLRIAVQFKTIAQKAAAALAVNVGHFDDPCRPKV